MADRLHLFHTGEQHVPVFEKLFEDLAPGLELDHTVRADLLDRAMASGGLTDEIARETESALRAVAADGIATLCTCSTIGPAVDRITRSGDLPVMRIDVAMARRAVELSDTITIAAAAISTLEPTKALVERVADEAGRKVGIEVVHIAEAWPHFQAGNSDAYVEAIAERLRKLDPVPSVVILAQASMAGAARLLEDWPATVLSSPRLGALAAIEMARQQGH